MYQTNDIRYSNNVQWRSYEGFVGSNPYVPPGTLLRYLQANENLGYPWRDTGNHYIAVKVKFQNAHKNVHNLQLYISKLLQRLCRPRTPHHTGPFPAGFYPNHPTVTPFLPPPHPVKPLASPLKTSNMQSCDNKHNHNALYSSS